MQVYLKVDGDRNDGYVIYEDVFNHKKYKIIDIAMSSTFRKTNYDIYIYNQIISFDI